MKYIYFLSIILLVSCSVNNETGIDSSEVSFKTNSDSYALGSTIKSTLKNDSDEVVGINLCFTTLEQRVNGEWQFRGPNIYCGAIQNQLKPGREKRYEIDLADSLNLSKGRYRLTTGVEIHGENLKVHTQEFDVRGTAQQ